jgi:hypothetical protein
VWNGKRAVASNLRSGTFCFDGVGGWGLGVFMVEGKSGVNNEIHYTIIFYDF